MDAVPRKRKRDEPLPLTPPPADGAYRKHPRWEHLSVNASGEVWSAKVARHIGTVQKNTGRWQVSLKDENKTIARARIVYEAWNGQELGSLTVDHIDGDKTNDAATNLQALARGPHARKSSTELSVASRKSQVTKTSKPVVGTHVDGRAATWESMTAAAKALDVHYATVQSAIVKGHGRIVSDGNAKGWSFLFQERDDAIEGEEWRTGTLLYNGSTYEVTASSEGRVRGSNGAPWYGTDATIGYRIKGFTSDDGTARATLLVHRVVAHLFLPPPPSAEHTEVDHLDQNRHNNAASNLEWVTPDENKLRANGKAVVGTDPATGEVKVIARSLKAAGDALGVNAQSIRASIRGKCLCRGLAFRYDET